VPGSLIATTSPTPAAGRARPKTIITRRELVSTAAGAGESHDEAAAESGGSPAAMALPGVS